MNRHYSLILACAVALFSCCNKATDNTTAQPTPVPTPAPAPFMPAPPAHTNNHWGVMLALKLDYSYNATAQAVSTKTQMGMSMFYNGIGTGSLTSAGVVTMNDKKLEAQASGSYMLTGGDGTTAGILFADGDVKWNIAGAAVIPAFNYTDAGSFPQYSGTLPDEVDRTKNLDIELGGKISGADSVYIVISTSGPAVVKGYSAKPAPAKITITAAELSALPAVADNGAYIQVVSFVFNIQDIAGKEYAFVKEHAVIQAIKIK